MGLEKWPVWSERALQGLAFWMGHRHSLYRGYPLGEAALVAEACNLIFANLDADETLLCERQYSQLMPAGSWPVDLGPKARADLVVVRGLSHAESEKRQSLIEHLAAVIEIKRAFAPKAQIDQDLARLAVFKRANPAARAFLFVVAEAKRPARFVHEAGRALLGQTDIAGFGAHYRVRRACKAAAAFSGKESAHYACIVEVYEGNASPKLKGRRRVDR